MPLPKLPTKPATLLLAEDYPKAEPGKPVARALAPAKPQLSAVPDTPQPTPVKKSTRTKAAPVAVAAPVAELTPQVAAPAAKPARARKADLKADIVDETPVIAKHKQVDAAPKSKASRQADQAGKTKLFVLDTNVLMHDPTSLFRFEEHDVYLPMMTLEELDNHKKGMSEVARNARQVSRSLDALVGNLDDGAIEDGILLSKLGNKDAKGRLYFQTRLQEGDVVPEGLPIGKADNQILGVVRNLEREYPGRAIVLVSKDINMRIKARALGLAAEDYFNDKVLEDTELLYAGSRELP
ncbi:MAG: PIN domain-containing protein, partial [Gammaproteobacteria bacterium]